MDKGCSAAPDHIPCPAIVARSDCHEHIPSWLLALPYPAALVSYDGATLDIENCNALFQRHFKALIDNPDIDGVEWQRYLLDQISSFALSKNEVSRFDIERQSVLGTEVYMCTLAWVQNSADSSPMILVSAIDRTADRRVEDSLRRELVSDTLTALPNRIGFGEAVESMLLDFDGEDPDTGISVIIIDLMRFSRINEALGTMAGDELILAVAARLKARLGDDILLARLGGDEFGICCTIPQGEDHIHDLVKRIKDTITAPVRLANLEISIDCAIGCSLVPVAEAEADELIRQAQTAARSGKKTGRAELYQPGELKIARRRFLIESQLRDTLANGGLNLMYQPIIELASSTVVGFEALARWEDPEMGVISPVDFIPVAEESGLVVQLGRWALQEAMCQLRSWDAKMGMRVPVKMNVNLSPIQMVRDDVIATITRALQEAEQQGDRLTIELTESAIVGDPEKSLLLLNALKKSHIAVAMDDFGTGYSNMASLQSLPIDVLKIDRSFVSDMLVDQDKMAITKAILSLAKALNMKATAEGIEDAEVAEALRDLGCTYGQGYYFAKPMNADDALNYWLESSKRGIN
ncbi:MAG: bifunctional diguanylate cyclase/phosphodiesterase [Sphingobium sp.]|nr:bifunctional diguanylate cyclase/phosphodiesterase [Sphingobium sp.]MCP5397724.1 bifunctional diguanylate cyclase/phosphodiesterase [Sphingomonas sp.]